MTPQDKIQYVFVVMLENHSFDVMLGNSGISGVQSPVGNTNSYNGNTYPVTSSAPSQLTTDPGHELLDTLQQLTNKPMPLPQPGPVGQWPKPLGPYAVPLGAYPRRDFASPFALATGFVTNYATNWDEDNKNPAIPAAGNIGDVLKCFDPEQLPILNKLANEFAVCTNWFSSIPGPTWPNRFFLHSASSGGLDCTPTQSQIKNWVLPGHVGFTTPNGSIFDALNANNIKYTIYNDCYANRFIRGFNSCFSDNPREGGGLLGLGYIPQVAALHGISTDSWYELEYYFQTHLSAYTPESQSDIRYVFIEPHYGNLHKNTYQGGSSQHPMDDVYGGEALLKFIYETLRANEDVWNKSLLIVTYDEHGGFYDSVPPPAAVPPGDGNLGHGQPGTLNQFGFQFDQFGIRVPALLISPWIAKGVVDATQYDHTSVIKTLMTLFDVKHPKSGTNYLTQRDFLANSVLGQLTDVLRTDCPLVLPNPAPSVAAPRPRPTKDEIQKLDKESLPDSGNIVGAMFILHKLHLEATSKSAHKRIRNRFAKIKTRGDLKAYAKTASRAIQAKRKLSHIG